MASRSTSDSSIRTARCVAAFLALAVSGCGSRTSLLAPSTGDSCPDSSTPIYVLVAGPSPDASDVIMRFDPPTGTFAILAPVPCLGYAQRPTAMAVDRAGDAYIVSSSDLNVQLFRVRPGTGACVLTPFTPSLGTTAMAFSADQSNVGETLYMITASSWLAAVDTSTFSSRNVGQDGGGQLASWVGAGAALFLTGSGAGDLFVAASFLTPPVPCVVDIDAGVPLSPDSDTGIPLPPPPKCLLTQGVPIGRIDKSSGSVTTAWSVPPTPLRGLAAWGEDFYLFASQPSGSLVLRFRRSDQSTVEVAQTDSTVLAVGVSTCAPLP